MQLDIFERLKNGEEISFNDLHYKMITDACKQTRELLSEINNSSDDPHIRSVVAKITESEIDETVTIFQPFHINYGKNTRFGKNIFINFGCTFLDLGGIEIEDNVMLAPGVKLLAESHPIEPEKRQHLTAKKIHIRQNAWIGANAVILQGVTIGKNSIVAAGAVVSKNVPDNTIVGGIPAEKLKNI